MAARDLQGTRAEAARASSGGASGEAPAVRASAFIATSLDGFIAREDGGLDWLPGTQGYEVPDGTPDAGGGVVGSAEAPAPEDHGYGAFMATVDALVMGRRTFETVRAFHPWPYGDTPVVVLAHRDPGIPPELADRVEAMAGAPAEVLQALAARGFRHVYVDGGRTIQGFLAAGLLQRLVLTRVPVLLGRGVPLFGPLLRDVALRHVATRAFSSGLVQSEYEVLPSGR